MMYQIKQNARRALAGGIAAALMGMASPALAEEDNISASAGISYNSHFISYGADVWGGGGSFFGKDSTTFVWGDVGVGFGDLTINVGAWADVNNNAPASLGGSIQEIDVYVGATYAIEKFSLGVTYQQWNYAGDQEGIVDLSVGFDDTGLLFEDFAFNPKAVWHFRVDSNGFQETGSMIVLSVSPSFALTEELSLTIPAGIGLLLDDDFHGGWKSGYGYSYIGASLGVALPFIPSSYGEWSANFDLTAYFTDRSAIPNNPTANFVVGSFGIKVAF